MSKVLTGVMDGFLLCEVTLITAMMLILENMALQKVLGLKKTAFICKFLEDPFFPSWTLFFDSLALYFQLQKRFQS